LDQNLDHYFWISDHFDQFFWAKRIKKLL